MVELTRERGLPFVALELGVDDPTISAIGIDNVAGARMAADHLAGLGHRRFGVLAMPFADDERVGPADDARVAASLYSDSRQRVEGYFAALAEHGIDTAAVPVHETRNDEASVRQALHHIFTAPYPPTAILAMSDRMALAALDWFREGGVRVPHDVSIIGFDGVPDGALSDPPLTTIAQPIAEIGRRAVQTILDHDGKATRERFPVSLVERRSTGPAAIG